MNKVKYINPESYFKAISKCNSGQLGAINSTDFEIEFEEIRPIEGYKFPVNKETGETFPNCCEWHKSIFESTIKWFGIFPNCCEWHKKLNTVDWFNKANYNDIVNKIVTQLSYTEYCISINIEKEDWYGAITEYIDWNFSSFGQLPHGFGSPVGINGYIEGLKKFIFIPSNNLPKDKAVKLIEFIDSFSNLGNKEKSTDLNILIDTYKKWLKIFPFKIRYFENLKAHFEKQLPILNGKPEINRYSGVAKAKVHTQSSLLEVLFNLTVILLDKVNVPELRKNGELSDIQATHLEFSDATLRTKATQITKQYSKGELRYVNVLKKWLQIHEEYFKEITPLLKNEPTQRIETKTERIKSKLEKFGFFTLPTVVSLSEPKKNRLAELLSTNKLPYCIAMFDYLGFIKYLEKEYFTSKYRLYKEVAKWFDSDKDGRAVKGNISSLLKGTTQNNKRYTAYQHKKTVQKDYQQLK